MATDFAGLPVFGEIHYGETQKDQRPVEEFYALLLDVLAFDDVKAVHWTQYTPYFNDGEQCIFGTGEVTISFYGIPEYEHASPWERGYSPGSPQVVGGYGTTYDSKLRQWVPVGEPFPKHPAADAFRAFTNCFGAHQVSLLKAFGDHAEVHATATSIQVETFDHD